MQPRAIGGNSFFYAGSPSWQNRHIRLVGAQVRTPQRHENHKQNCRLIRIASPTATAGKVGHLHRPGLAPIMKGGVKKERTVRKKKEERKESAPTAYDEVISQAMLEAHSDLPEQPLFLNQEQRQEVFDHLMPVFDDQEYAFFVVSAIDIDIANYSEATALGSKRGRRVDAQLLRPDFDPIRTACHKLYEAIKQDLHHNFLDEALRSSGLGVREINHILLVLAAACGQADQSFNKYFGMPKRGAPAKTAKKTLIRQIYGYYPKGMARLTRGGHFEQTIRLLLSYVGENPSDAYNLILSAIKMGGTKTASVKARKLEGNN